MLNIPSLLIYLYLKTVQIMFAFKRWQLVKLKVNGLLGEMSIHAKWSSQIQSMFLSSYILLEISFLDSHFLLFILLFLFCTLLIFSAYCFHQWLWALMKQLFFIKASSFVILTEYITILILFIWERILIQKEQPGCHL